MKKLVLILLILLFTGCKNINNYEKIEGKIVKCENQFIEIDGKTVRLMPEIKIGSKVTVYFGEEKNSIKKYSIYENWSNSSKIYLKNLVVGKEYYYKIKAENNGLKYNGKVEKLKKVVSDFNKVECRWAKERVFYQIFVRAFADSNGDGIGDLKGITDKLDYLKELGVGAIWLMPIFETDTYHGYDVKNYYKINKEYGTMEDFDELIKEADKRDIKIIMDFVINHTSNESIWFKDAEKRGKYRDYYMWKENYENAKELGMWGNPLWCGIGKNEYHAVFTGNMPDLNYRNSNVRDEIKKASKFCIEKGVDGFRLDAARHIDDFDHEVTVAWWKEFNMYTKELDKNIFLVGECFDENTAHNSEYMEYLDSVFNFMAEADIRSLLKGEKIDLIEKIIYAKELYYTSCNNYIDSIFLGNHDITRIASENPKSYNIAAAIFMTLPGTPYIYYGDELGQKGKGSDEMYRMPFEWSKTNNTKYDTKWAKSSFTKDNDGISLEEEKGDYSSTYERYKRLIKMRKGYPLFFYGEIEEYNDIKGVLGYTVFDNKKRIRILHNLTSSDIELKNVLENQIIYSGIEYKGVLKSGESIVFEIN